MEIKISKNICENIFKSHKNGMLFESIQKADKEFGGNVNYQKRRQDIIEVTGGDAYSYPLGHYVSNVDPSVSKGVLKTIYAELKQQPKNVFPISGVDIMNPQTYPKDFDLLYYVNRKQVMIKNLKKIPNVAIRNLRKDISLERSYNDFVKVYQTISDTVDLLRTEHVKELLNSPHTFDKIFSSKVKTFDNLYKVLLNFAFKDEYGELDQMTFEQKVDRLESIGDISIMQDDENAFVLEIHSANAMVTLGCDIGEWCFANKKHGFLDWSVYGGYAVLIVSKNSNRAYVITADDRLYDQYNDRVPKSKALDKLLRAGVSKKNIEYYANNSRLFDDNGYDDEDYDDYDDYDD